MKYILIILLLNGFISNAQWAPKGATWIYSKNNLGSEDYLKVEYKNDTIVHGINCKVFKKYQLMRYESTQPFTIKYLGIDIFYEKSGRIMFLKDGEFVLLYNFLAQVGDSWVIQGELDLNHPCDNESKTSLLNVVEKKIKNFNGNDAEIMTYTIAGKWTFLSSIAVNIGSIGSYLPLPLLDKSCEKIDYYSQFYTSLQCYTSGEGKWINFNGINCNAALTSINIPKSNNVYIVNDNNTLNIKNLDALIDYTIYNSVGQTLIQKNNDDSNEISVKSLPTGFYYITLAINNLSQSYNLKFYKK